jgi:hypothetical protein
MDPKYSPNSSKVVIDIGGKSKIKISPFFFIKRSDFGSFQMLE